MLSIHERMVSSYKKITTKQIWEYLNELYNLTALVLMIMFLQHLFFKNGPFVLNIWLWCL